MKYSVETQDLCVSYGDGDIVHGVSLAVRPGEIVSLLGPSGCGKTTTLRAIAGFILPSAGRVKLHGIDQTTTPSNRRNIGFVFQGYALFPHLSVFDNVAYGLRARGVQRAQIAERVERALRLVQLEDMVRRRPRQLSGGQQQRVAIARALVIEPDVLLLDEPLSNLDAKLRHSMRTELRRLLKATQIASIFVTHDQEEALAISDRIVLMNAGRVEQQGTPEEVYSSPCNLFAASFLGQANLLHGTVEAIADDGTATVLVEGARLLGQATEGLRTGMPAVLVVRHDRVRLVAAACSPCRVEAATFLGAAVEVQCVIGSQRITGLETNARLPVETKVRPEWAVADARVYPA